MSKERLKPLLDMLTAALAVKRHISGLTKDQFLNDKKSFDAVANPVF